MTKFNTHSFVGKLRTGALRPLAVIAFALFLVSSISAQSEFFNNAFANAARPPVIGGGGWVITAKVYIKAANKDYISAVGRVTLGSDGTLGGDLPMSINNSPVANNTINIHIRKSNPAVVVVRRNVAGKAFLGRPASLASLPVDPAFNYLNGPIDWAGGQGSVQIFLESEFVKKASPPSGGSGKPIGARYQIGGFMRVTNSSDGAGDNTVELYGALYLHQFRKDGQEVGSQTIIKLIPQDANNGFEMQFNNNVFIDAYDGDTLTLEGSFRDRDAGQGLSGDDDMFIGTACLDKFGVYNLYRITQRDGSMLCKGDQNSESADIRIFAKKIKDLY
ncbi:hypothetical protein BH10ACI3_BH10ACI3_08070 [soil metagenome]